MDEQELTALIGKTAALMEQFDRRCGDIDGRLQALAAELERVTRQVPTIVRQSADGTLATLPALVLDRMGSGLERPVQDYQQRVRTAGTEIEGAALRLSGQISRLERLHRLLLWKTVGAVAACLALLLGGGAWLSMHYAGVIRDNQLSAELLRAYNSADVTLCERGRLCARVDPAARRYGDHGQYAPVAPR
jgi:hypothetical protein